MTRQEEADDGQMQPKGMHGEDKFLQAVGLALRARQTVLGQENVLRSIQTGRSRLVIVASDAGANGTKKFRDKCAFYKVPLVFAADRERLGAACGRPYTAVISVVEEGFATMLMRLAREIYGGEAFGETSGL